MGYRSSDNDQRLWIDISEDTAAGYAHAPFIPAYAAPQHRTPIPIPPLSTLQHAALSDFSGGTPHSDYSPDPPLWDKTPHSVIRLEWGDSPAGLSRDQ